MTNESPAALPASSAAAPAAAPRARLHPLVATAAVSLIVLSGVGVASMTGLIGSPRASDQQPQAAAQAPGDAGRDGPAARAGAASTDTTAAPTQAPRVAAQNGPPPSRTATATHAAGTSHPNAAVPRHQPVPARANSAPAAVAEASDATPPERTRTPARAETRPANTGPGWATVSSVRTVERPAKASGLGAIGGAIAGGALGNQIGEGKGNTAATVVGLLGGAVAGHQIERRVRTERVVEVTLGGDDGVRHTLAFAHDPGWQPGDRVRVEDARAAERRDPATPRSADGAGGDTAAPVRTVD